MTRSVLESCRKRLLLAVAVCAAVAAPAVAGNAQDDLQAVRKAVLASSGSQARPPAEDPAGAVAETKPQPRAKGEPMWFRVRIVEKASKRARVSINLPIGLVRSFGDDWPIPPTSARRPNARLPTSIASSGPFPPQRSLGPSTPRIRRLRSVGAWD